MLYAVCCVLYAVCCVLCVLYVRTGIAACDGLWDEMSSDTAVYLVGHFFKLNPKASGNEAAEFLLAQALKLVVKRLQAEEPQMAIDTVEQLMALPPGKDGRRALHDDISIAVIRYVLMRL